MVKTCPGTLSVLVTIVSVPLEQFQYVVLYKVYIVHLLAKCYASLLGTRYPNVI